MIAVYNNTKMVYTTIMQKYIEFASYLKRNNGKPPNRALSKAEQYTLKVYRILQDGQWHSAAAIALKLNLNSLRYVRNILVSLKAPLGIESSQLGYRLKNNDWYYTKMV